MWMVSTPTDPLINKDAIKYDTLSYMDMLNEGLGSNGFHSFFIMYG